jgi:alkanesulfonate monooxygenase SsuD/methylene tetrahydromethanopterin reductase-like flavin-dependent oxidoreductase (luciferase family)
MRFDIFFSICQTEVDGFIPSEKVMWRNFFSQAELADSLGFGTAWIAETHLSCQIQKRNPGAVIPNFTGEIGLNTDVLQVAHKLFAKTKNLHIGSAIRNILCNGGPMAHAEAIRTFLSLHGLEDGEKRLLDIGFASGRFPFSNIPYGIRPRNELEKRAWPVLRGQVFLEATEIFLRFLRGDVFASRDVAPKILSRDQFRSDSDWASVVQAWQTLAERTGEPTEIEIPSFWTFDDVGVIPFEAPMNLLRLTIGAHDAASQDFANRFWPVGVFNLSITPGAVIEETHQRMQKTFHTKGGWTRQHMPRTVLVFIDDGAALSGDEKRRRAGEAARRALGTYWKAIEGTLDPRKIEGAVDNALVGSPEDIIEQIKTRFNPDDRLMLWFDFNNHDNESVKRSMRTFMEKVAPHFSGGLK